MKNALVASTWHCLGRWLPHLVLGIMAVLRPLLKPRIVKKRTKKFWHQSDPYAKIKCNWQQSAEMIQGPGLHTQSTLVMGARRKQSPCCPVASGNSESTTSINWKCI
jgi:hypothetical protein